ncbi:hypothetical protein BGW36DRAFT_187240 [Talaromyces proteolyticus]|uniref:Uncharacterized protein n=1 Tax=Talaromyces proteolyticus TaxID=1131652 RepID=A0AAD4KPS2_9EURO|nr:uncharacterized protein BGW36DRAFT_187240 [Talaromyces proteolyticus]KAH8696436.1 hypothetical protein BGW36DRAFT_187240 [Talaromyces proteolyticus]
MAALPTLRRQAASLLRPLTSSTTAPAGKAIPPPLTSAFSTSAAQNALKEGDTNRDNVNEEYERLKEQSLSEAKQGKRYWKQELASESEAGVKADRGETGASQDDGWMRSDS